MKHSTFYLMTETLGAGGACIPAGAAAAQATARRRPGGGSGSNGSRSGYTWRDAALSEVVYATPATRPRATNANAPAAARRLSSASSSAPSRAGHTLGEWSAWLRAGGVEYRYRWGLNPRDLRYAGSVDAMFQVRNLQTRLGGLGPLAG